MSTELPIHSKVILNPSFRDPNIGIIFVRTHFRTLSGKSIQIEYNKTDDTIAQLKQKIEDQEGISSDQQRLFCDG